MSDVTGQGKIQRNKCCNRVRSSRDSETCDKQTTESEKNGDEKIWQTKFPNYCSLTEEEKSMLRDTLVAARNSIERRENITVGAFGTIHDELLTRRSDYSSPTGVALTEKGETEYTDPEKEADHETESAKKESSFMGGSPSSERTLAREEFAPPDVEIAKKESMHVKFSEKEPKTDAEDESEKVPSAISCSAFGDDSACDEKRQETAEVDSSPAEETNAAPIPESSNIEIEVSNLEVEQKEEHEGGEDDEGRDEDRKGIETTESKETDRGASSAGAEGQDASAQLQRSFTAPRFKELDGNEKAIFFELLEAARKNVATGGDSNGRKETVAYGEIVRMYSQIEGSRSFNVIDKKQQIVRVKLGMTIESKDNERIRMTRRATEAKETLSAEKLPTQDEFSYVESEEESSSDTGMQTASTFTPTTREEESQEKVEKAVEKTEEEIAEKAEGKVAEKAEEETVEKAEEKTVEKAEKEVAEKAGEEIAKKAEEKAVEKTKKETVDKSEQLAEQREELEISNTNYTSAEEVKPDKNYEADETTAKTEDAETKNRKAESDSGAENDVEETSKDNRRFPGEVRKDADAKIDPATVEAGKGEETSRSADQKQKCREIREKEGKNAGKYPDDREPTSGGFDDLGPRKDKGTSEELNGKGKYHKKRKRRHQPENEEEDEDEDGNANEDLECETKDGDPDSSTDENDAKEAARRERRHGNEDPQRGDVKIDDDGPKTNKTPVAGGQPTTDKVEKGRWKSDMSEDNHGILKSTAHGASSKPAPSGETAEKQPGSEDASRSPTSNKEEEEKFADDSNEEENEPKMKSSFVQMFGEDMQWDIKKEVAPKSATADTKTEAAAATSDARNEELPHRTTEMIRYVKAPKTKVRILQDLLKDRAEFVRTSADLLVVKHVASETASDSDLVHETIDEQELDVEENRGLKKKYNWQYILGKICSCGQKETDEADAIVENLKGESVPFQMEGKTRNAASATLDPPTMRVLQAAKRKRIVEHYSKL